MFAGSGRRRWWPGFCLLSPATMVPYPGKFPNFATNTGVSAQLDPKRNEFHAPRKAGQPLVVAQCDVILDDGGYAMLLSAAFFGIPLEILGKLRNGVEVRLPWSPARS